MLKEHEAGAKTTDLTRKHGVSEATRYRSCQPPDAELRTRLRDLSNARRHFLAIQWPTGNCLQLPIGGGSSSCRAVRRKTAEALRTAG